MQVQSYILYLRDHHCMNCSHGWTTSELYRIEISGDNRRVEVHSGAPLPGCSFGTSRLLPREVAVCYRCAEAFEMNWRKGLDEAEKRWQDTIKRKTLEYNESTLRTPQKPVSKEAERRAAAPSIDEL